MLTERSLSTAAKRRNGPLALRNRSCQSRSLSAFRSSRTTSVLRETELAVSIENMPGAEELVLSTVMQQGTSVRALCSYNDQDRTVMLLVPENAARAKQALEDAGFDCWANPVVVVGLENRIGAVDHAPQDGGLVDRR